MVLLPLLLQAAPADFRDANELLYVYRSCVAAKVPNFAIELASDSPVTVSSAAMLACRAERTRYLDALAAANAQKQDGMAEGSRAKVLLQFITRIEASIFEETSKQVVKARSKGI